MYCHKCGTQLPEDSGFCHKCGTKIVRADSTQQTPMESVVTPPSVATQQMQASPIVHDHRQRNVVGLCKGVFALRLIAAIGWTLLIIVQLFGGVGFWHIIWNVIGTSLCYVFAMRLFGVISSNKFNSVRVSRVVEDNVGLAIIGVIFYGWQFFSEGILIMFLFIGLELAILVVGGIAYFSAKQIRKEATPDKDMTVSLQQDEVIILNGKCTYNMPYSIQNMPQKLNISYNGVGTLTNKRFIFISNPEYTREWAEDTYGKFAPTLETPDVIIALTDITNVVDKSKPKDQVKTLTIQTKTGKSYNFLFEVTIKDSWTNENKWRDAFQKAIAEVS